MRNTLLLLLVLALPAAATEKDLARVLEALDKAPKEKADYAADVRERLREFNRKDLEKWKNICSLDDWEKVRRDVLGAMKKRVLSNFEPQKNVKHLVTGTIPGDGFVIENIVYETIPGLIVTANLYRPESAVKNPPAILLISSHHNPKTQGELQDMGMMWARLGCLVLVPDQLGHGERRQHPFKDAASFPGAFKVGRQDYYFRYNVGVQLALVGESLVGWMARDMMRGVDLVLERGADPKRIILMGAVAGGGDPAGVTAALDERIACVVPFNFGGPQPETKHPLPEDAETSFNYHGGGSWESTRNLAYSASDRFPPWAIVASVAPRKLIHAHEFVWDRERDPVWKRYQKIWGWYKAPDAIGVAHGFGLLSQSGAKASHCNNIGAVHRKMIYPYLKEWFGIPIPTEEYQNRVSNDKLQCMTDKAREFFQPKSVARLALEFHQRRPKKAPPEPDLVRQFPRLFERPVTVGNVRYEKVTWREKSGPPLGAALILSSVSAKKEARPLVLAIAQQGAVGFLKHRSEAIAALLEKGIDVALVDVRGTGELAVPGSRRRTSPTTSLSASEWMMGQSVLDVQLQQLRAVLADLREAGRWDAGRIALWGDSFAPVNDETITVEVPHDAPKQPHLAEPVGPTLVQLIGAMDKRVAAVYANGGLSRFASLLESGFFHVPHDAVRPGMLLANDLPDIAARVAPTPLRIEGLVDGRNRPIGKMELKAYASTREAYARRGAAEDLAISPSASSQREISEWIARPLVK